MVLLVSCSKFKFYFLFVSAQLVGFQQLSIVWVLECFIYYSNRALIGVGLTHSNIVFESFQFVELREILLFD